MFNDDEWAALIAKLLKLTEADRVKWSLDTSKLSLDIGEVTYLIDSADEDGVPPWVLHVRKGPDWNWTEIDTLTSAAGWDKADPRVLLLELRDSAYRMTLGGPQLAQNLLNDLDQLDTNSAEPESPEEPFVF